MKGKQNKTKVSTVTAAAFEVVKIPYTENYDNSGVNITLL